ncbi:MAG: LysE family translocator [Bacteroidota bacterium]
MQNAAIEGILMGLLLSVLVGPVFFLLMETSINKGVKQAIMMDAGVILSDTLWIVILYFGAAGLLHKVIGSSYANLVGGIIFLGLGAAMLRQRGKGNSDSYSLQVSKGSNFLKGFIVNTLNPAVAVFWLGAVSLTVAEFEDSPETLLAFFLCVLTTVLLTDLAKILAASKLKRWLSPKVQSWFDSVTGLVLLIFGIVFLLKLF